MRGKGAKVSGRSNACLAISAFMVCGLDSVGLGFLPSTFGSTVGFEGVKELRV